MRPHAAALLQTHAVPDAFTPRHWFCSHSHVVNPPPLCTLLSHDRLLSSAGPSMVEVLFSPFLSRSPAMNFRCFSMTAYFKVFCILLRLLYFYSAYLGNHFVLGQMVLISISLEGSTIIYLTNSLQINS